MTIRTRRYSVLLCLAFTAAGCEKAADDQEKARLAQSVANDKISAAQREADEKVASADASFRRLREDYRHTTTANLLDLDRDVAALAAKAAPLSGQVRTDLDASIARIREGRAAFVKNYEALDSASGATWDDTKARLDAEWVKLKDMVSRAS